jgi:hypothetical protein
MWTWGALLRRPCLEEEASGEASTAEAAAGSWEISCASRSGRCTRGCRHRRTITSTPRRRPRCTLWATRRRTLPLPSSKPLHPSATTSLATPSLPATRWCNRSSSHGAQVASPASALRSARRRRLPWQPTGTQTTVAATAASGAAATHNRNVNASSWAHTRTSFLCSWLGWLV